MLRDEVSEGSHCAFFQFFQGVRVVCDKTNRQFKEFSLHNGPSRMLKSIRLAYSITSI